MQTVRSQLFGHMLNTVFHSPSAEEPIHIAKIFVPWKRWSGRNSSSVPYETLNAFTTLAIHSITTYYVEHLIVNEQIFVYWSFAKLMILQQ